MTSQGFCVLMTLLVIAFQSFSFVQASVDAVNKGQGNRSCPVQLTITENVHNGWPFSFSCGDYVNYDFDEWTCVVSEASSGEVIFNATEDTYYMYDVKHFLQSVHENHSDVYYLDIITSDGGCSRYVIQLNFSDVEYTTCNESLVSVEHWDSDTEIGKQIKLRCISGPEDPYPVHAKYEHNHTVIWRRNCSDVNVTGAWIDDTKQMNIDKIGYEHAGIYTCSFVINGQEKFLAHRKICVKPMASTGRVVLKCAQRNFRVNMGQKVLFECVMDMGNGYTKNLQHSVKWKKMVGSNVTTLCMNNAQELTDGVDQRMHCKFATDPPCFLHVPTDAELDESRFMTTVKFWIDNVKAKDLGEYVVAVRQDHEVVANVTLLVELNREPHVIRSCPVQLTITENVHNGWPFSFSCGDYVNYDFDEWTCVVSEASSGEVIFNATEDTYYMYDVKHFLQSVHENHSDVYYLDIITSDGGCSRYVIQLNFSDVEYTTCNESLVSVEHWDSDTEIGKQIKLRCISGPEDPYPVHAQYEHNHTVIWRRNCSDVNVTGAWIDDTKQMNIDKIGYEHAGIYTCSFVINGQEKFLAHRKICVKPMASTGRVVLKCAQRNFRVNMGQKVLFECVMDMGNGYTKNLQHSVKWKKMVGSNVTTLCMNNAQELTDGVDQRMHCKFATDPPCFLHVPTDAELDESRFMTTVKFWIDNVKAKDLGEYVVAVRQDHEVVANVTLLVELNREPHVISINYVILICLLCVVFLLLVILLLFWQRFYICLYYKRTFGNYATDDKKYGAFISYHFSTEMDKFAQQLTRDATAATIANLESLGYRVYDENRDGYLSEMRVDSSVNAMRLCHRVVILLTPEYLKDHWSIFCLQKGFQNMIDSNSKLIFVMIPGTREYIRQHSDVDETHRMIRRAMRLNHAIHWSNTRSFDKRRFKHELEWAMPKLATQRSVRHESTTSSLLSQQYANGFHRTMSVETEVTEAGSPKPTGEQFTCFVIEPDTCPSNTSL